MSWRTAWHSWEHFQVWTQVVSYTGSVNRVADSAVSSTYNHLTATLSSLFRSESNTQLQPSAKSQSLTTLHSRHQHIQKPVQFLPRDWTFPTHTWEVQVFRARGPGPGTLPLAAAPATTRDNAISSLSQIKQWRELLNATQSNPLLSCSAEQNTPYLSVNPPNTSALCFGI